MPVATKTWSRESAGLLLLILVWSIYQGDVALVTTIIWPILSYAAVAYGLKRLDGPNSLLRTRPSESSDWGRSQRSSEYSARPGERADSRSEDFQRTDY
jgi:hypothetical protein